MLIPSVMGARDRSYLSTALSEGQGAIKFEGLMVDYANVKQAEPILAAAKLAQCGVSRRPGPAIGGAPPRG